MLLLTQFSPSGGNNTIGVNKLSKRLLCKINKKEQMKAQEEIEFRHQD